MTSLTARQRLSQRAVQLKKAWILAALMAGYVPRGSEAIIPDYSSWSRKALEPHVADLESDLREALKHTIASQSRRLQPQALSWLAAHFDRWHKAGFGLLRLSTAQDFESNVGELRARSHLDIPPYAELLIQPGIDVAFRHPEYMLVRDLECLHNLYRDAERLLETVNWSSPPEWAAAASENAQTLARTVMLTCFNLLESFVSGLARAHVMLHSSLDETVTSKLLSTQDALRRRIVSVPRQILGREPLLDLNKPPLSIMFGSLKQYRDSFVHCEPGDRPSAHGYVKEELFHDVSPKLVNEAVLTTQAVIRLVWKAVYGVDGPRWLGLRDSSGQHSRQNLTVAPPPKHNTVAAPSKAT